MKKNLNKLWGGAFTQMPDEVVVKFIAGRDVQSVGPADQRLIPYDIWGSQVHCLILIKQKIISKTSGKVILQGLEKLKELVIQGKFTLDPKLEDVHTNVESWLMSKYGIEYSGKLHTARSRNDQIALDTKLYLRTVALDYIKVLIELENNLIFYGKKYVNILCPGFTHHQQAMVTTLGHILISFAVMMDRDLDKFCHWHELHNTNPLGSVAGFGTSFPIDRDYTSKLLGFEGPMLNSLDAVSSRGETEADFLYAIVSMMNHLSVMAQTFIILSTTEFNMLKLGDKFSAGSSIMPQKKNPQPLEVIKAKAAYVQGQLMGVLGLNKSNFIGYNSDSQWSKYMLMDGIDETSGAAKIIQGVIETMEVNQENMEHWCHKGFIGATTLLEQITAQFKIPFRQAKVLVETAIKHSLSEDMVQYKALKQAMKVTGINIDVTEEQINTWQDPKTIIELTKSFGGPGKESLNESLKLLKKNLAEQKKWLQNKQSQIKSAKSLLQKEVLEIMKV